MIRHRKPAHPVYRAPDIRIRFAPLPPEDIVIVRGFRVTSITRTLIDLSGELLPDEAARLTRQAIDKGLVSLEDLRRAAEARTDLESIESFRQVLRRLE